MFTIDRIINELNKLCAADGITLDVPVAINSRLTRSMGRVISKAEVCETYGDGYMHIPTKIEFARNLIDNASDDDILQVIKHEYVHYFLYILEPTVRHGHDAMFKRKCAAIGCTHSKATGYVEGFRDADAKSKYEVWCDDCNEIIATYARKCKTLNNIHYCTCGNCHGSNLRVVQNW